MNKEIRPWGWFEVLRDGPNYKIKHLHVNSNQKLSLQSHNHRNELWLVLEGQGKAIVEPNTYFISKNDRIWVPKYTKHRLITPPGVELDIIELQTGDYFGEDDIIRYEDDYNRV